MVVLYHMIRIKSLHSLGLRFKLVFSATCSFLAYTLNVYDNLYDVPESTHKNSQDCLASNPHSDRNTRKHSLAQSYDIDMIHLRQNPSPSFSQHWTLSRRHPQHKLPRFFEIVQR